MKTLQKDEGKDYSTLGALLLPVGEYRAPGTAAETSSLSHPYLKSLFSERYQLHGRDAFCQSRSTLYTHIKASLDGA